MREPEHAGLNAFDAERAHSMEDEGGASAARVEAEIRPHSRATRAGGLHWLALLAGAVAAAAFVWWRKR